MAVFYTIMIIISIKEIVLHLSYIVHYTFHKLHAGTEANNVKNKKQEENLLTSHTKLVIHQYRL